MTESSFRVKDLYYQRLVHSLHLLFAFGIFCCFFFSLFHQLLLAHICLASSAVRWSNVAMFWVGLLSVECIRGIVGVAYRGSQEARRIGIERSI